MFLEENLTRIEKDLDLAERTLDDVRRRYGFTDLEAARLSTSNHSHD